MIFLKQSLTVAAYEGSRTALEQGAVLADVDATCQQILSDRRVQGAQLTVTPSNFDTLNPGDYIDVFISAPAEPNAVLPVNFFRGKTLSARVSMMKEF